MEIEILREDSVNPADYPPVNEGRAEIIGSQVYLSLDLSGTSMAKICISKSDISSCIDALQSLIPKNQDSIAK
jgi:hypothetical protein